MSTRNPHGGKKGRKMKNSKNADNYSKMAMVFAEPGEQFYAIIIKNIGNGQVHLKVHDTSRQSIYDARGRPVSYQRKKGNRFLIAGRICIVSLREFEIKADGTSSRKMPTVDVLHIYDDEEHVRHLSKNELIPKEFIKIISNETSNSNPSSKPESKALSGFTIGENFVIEDEEEDVNETINDNDIDEL